MKIFLFTGSRRGYAVLNKLIATKANICGILCLVEDPHEEPFYPKVGAIAEMHQIPIFYTTDVKPSDYDRILETIKPDIAFAIGWRYLISKSVYSIPPKGFLVIHDSLLPKYRGFAPMNWAIINGEEKTGVTLFHIAESIDCGPIVDQLEMGIHIEDTAKTVDEKMITLYEEIVSKNLPRLASGTTKSIPQDESSATYTCKRTPEDGEIHWHEPAIKIYNLIRGLTQPFPGAYTTLHGKKIYIWEAALPLKQETFVGNIPGRVLGKRHGMLEVLTGQGVLRLKRLQYAHDEEMPVMDFKISVKDTFGK